MTKKEFQDKWLTKRVRVKGEVMESPVPGVVYVITTAGYQVLPDKRSVIGLLAEDYQADTTQWHSFKIMPEDLERYLGDLEVVD
jgi:hypothetical protein